MRRRKLNLDLPRAGKAPPVDMADQENPEWTAEDFAKAKGPDSLPEHVLSAFPNTKNKGGRPKSARTKVPVTIRLDPDVVDHFKATGDGWQSRINAALAEDIRAKRA